MKVLIVGGFPGPGNKIFGGIVTSCSALMHSSFSDKFDVLTIDSTQKSNPIPPLIFRLFYAGFRMFRYLVMLLIKRPKTVILFHSTGVSLLEKGVMAWIAFFLRIPVFMFPRGGALIEQVNESLITKIWVTWAFAGASKVICQGPAWQKFARDTLEFSKENCPIVYNWTATEALLDIGKQRLQVKKDPPLNILYLGWLEKEKGVFDLIEACSDISRENINRIYIAGGGRCANELREMVVQKGMGDFVKFFGWIDGAEVEGLLRDSDILVLPSWAEGFPNAVIEAMASGLAVVVTSVGNIPDILTHEAEVLLVPPKDTASLTLEISRLTESHDLWKSVAIRGHAYAAEHFSVERAARDLEKLVYSVTD